MSGRRNRKPGRCSHPTSLVDRSALRFSLPFVRFVFPRAAFRQWRAGAGGCCRLVAWLFLLAVAGGAGIAKAAEDFLEPEAAFTLTARPVDDRSVELRFTAAPGYYLYRDQFRFSADVATLGPPVLPPGKVKFDETFQKSVETYRGEVRIVLPVSKAPPAFVLFATNQGCADKGLCYPPMQRAVRVELRGFGVGNSARVLTVAETAALSSGFVATATGPASPLGGVDAGATSGEGSAGLDAVLRGGRFWSVVGVFFLAGVLLSLTPCVLPMLPILSSIIVGQGARASRGRGLLLAVSYSLGMALVYTALGVAAGLAGEGFAALLQNPWVLTLFAATLAVFALSMFGTYELRLPAAFTGRLTLTSNRLPAGRVASVFAMGGVSALIVSPCVAAPLAGALVYLSQTRDVALGGTALFCLAAGMSMPLILVGASAGALLPRAGAWMDEVKRFFGLLLLGVALWTVQSLLPGAVVLALWGVLALGAAAVAWGEGPPAGPVLRRSSRNGRRLLAGVLAVCGLLQFAGAASGGSNPLQPLEQLLRRGREAAAAGIGSLAFRPVRNAGALDAALASAARPVMLDFYADWCVSCKEMERFTFTDQAVRARLAGALLLRVDVTANNADDRALLKRFALFGPPGMIFFDAGGKEIVAARVIGYQDSSRFLRTLESAGI